MSANDKRSRVIALGFFDGVHIGHGVLLRKTAEVADRLGVCSCALTFDSHPDALILGNEIPLLCTVGERADLIRHLYGIEEVIFAHFDAALMHMTWREFFEDLLIGRFGARHVVAGYDFHFGYRGEGNVRLLQEVSAEFGLGCDIVSRVELDGITVSSTYIRKLVAQGDMERARMFLGHPYALSGHVAHGRKLGTVWETPTVNIPLPPGVQCPAKGVYMSTVRWDSTQSYPGVTNIGTRPTVNFGHDVLIETHILDFKGDLYGKQIRVELHKFLRPEKSFASVEALMDQIRLDVQRVKEA